MSALSQVVALEINVTIPRLQWLNPVVLSGCALHVEDDCADYDFLSEGFHGFLLLGTRLVFQQFIERLLILLSEDKLSEAEAIDNNQRYAA